LSLSKSAKEIISTQIKKIIATIGVNLSLNLVRHREVILKLLDMLNDAKFWDLISPEYSKMRIDSIRKQGLYANIVNSNIDLNLDNEDLEETVEFFVGDQKGSFVIEDVL